MQSEAGLTTHFELSDSLYAEACIRQPRAVGIWLGANVMVEYSFEEAIELLQKNLATAQKSLKEVEEDLDFLKEQITVVEVSTFCTCAAYLSFPLLVCRSSCHLLPCQTWRGFTTTT